MVLDHDPREYSPISPITSREIEEVAKLSLEDASHLYFVLRQHEKRFGGYQ